MSWQRRQLTTVRSAQFQCQSIFKHLYFLIIDSIKALYEYLLNREYAEPLALEHTMERKGVRSPSMRLRFGRSDPDVPLITRVRLIYLHVCLVPHSTRVSFAGE